MISSLAGVVRPGSSARSGLASSEGGAAAAARVVGREGGQRSKLG